MTRTPPREPFLLAVMGPTASGKTTVAEAVADHYAAQLINADAFQVYRGMDIGTAKPASRDRYLLLDLKNPDQGFGAGEFVIEAAAVLRDLYTQGRSAVLVGGTGLYVRALMEAYADLREAPDPVLRERLVVRLQEEGLAVLADELRRLDPPRAERTDLRNPARVVRALERIMGAAVPIEVALPPFHKRKIVINPPEAVLAPRITQRVAEMVQNGWVEEVARLRAEGFGPGTPGFRAIGYRAISDHLEGLCTREEAMQTAVRESLQYAKRQRTWLRSEPNVDLVIASGEPATASREALLYLDGEVG